MDNFSYLDVSAISSISAYSTSLFTTQGPKTKLNNFKHISKDFSILDITQPSNNEKDTYEIFSNFCDLLSNLKVHAFETCDQFQEILKDYIFKIQENKHWSMEIDSNIVLLTNELETWNIVNTLFRDRIRVFDNMDINQPYNVHLSESKLTANLFSEDAAVRQAQIIVDWLENCSRIRSENCNLPVKFQLERMSTCENTLHLLKQNTKLDINHSKNIVNDLDADAATRQRKKMCDLDTEDEQQLLTYIIMCIRSGMLDKACDACIKVGQFWRAITLEGWKLYHDPNMENINLNGQLTPTEGNKNRILWKKICWSMLKEPGISNTEKTIYAILSGNLDHALSYFTNSWHDRLWVHMKIFVEQRVEMNLSIKFLPLEQKSNLPEKYFIKSLTIEQIFTEIESCPSEAIKHQSSLRINQIQKYLILGDISSLIDYMHSWCIESSNKPQPQFLRFMAHLILFFKAINIVETNFEKCSIILKTYVELLISENQRNLVAAYISYLPADYQIIMYAKFLEDVKVLAARIECLTMAKSHNIDICMVTKLIVQNKIQKINFDINEEIDIASDITQFDAELIESLEWLLFDPLQRNEAIHQANVMFRYLIASNKLTACFKLSKLLPNNSISVILANHSCKLTKDLPYPEQNNICEFISYKTYLDSLETFEDWNEHFQKIRPTKIGTWSGGSFAEKVAHEQKLKQYETDYTRWLNSSNAKAQVAIEKLTSVLTFPDGGWLEDIEYTSPHKDNRELQLLNLRRSCLPDTCFRLHKVLHGMQRYKEAVQLSDLIESERFNLYQVFSFEMQEKLINLIAESSIELLANNFDPLGYHLY